MSRTDLNLSLRHQCLLRGASEHLWSLKYSSQKFSWGPAQSLYISLHLSTSLYLFSSRFFTFSDSCVLVQFACERVRLAAADEVPSNETVTCLCNIKQRCHEPRMLDTESFWVTWRSWKHCWPKYSHWHNECSHWRSSECSPCGQTVQDLEASRFDRRTSIDLSGEWQKGLAKGKYSKQTGMGT